MGEGERGEEKEGLTQNHSANRVTRPKSGCGSDWITHNTLRRHPPQVNTERAIGKEKPLKFFTDGLISCGTFMDRGIQKGSTGRSEVLSWNKNKTGARIVF